MKILKLLDKHIEEFILVILSTIMVVVIFIQVVLREMGSSLSWSEELARFSFIWLVYIGISYGVKQQRHIKIDVVLQFLKTRQRIILSVISNILFLIFAVIIVINGYDIASKLLNFGQKSPALHVPMGIVYLATPVGMALTSFRLIQNLITNFKFLAGKISEDDDSVKLEYEKIIEDEDDDDEL